MDRIAQRVQTDRKAVAVLCAAVCLHALVFFSVVLQGRQSLIAPLHHDTLLRTGPAADFFALYHASVNLQQGRDVYDRTPDGITPYFYPYRYLPVLAVLATPLTWLAPHASYLLWVAVLECLLLALLCQLASSIRDVATFTAAAVLLLLSSPFFLEIYMGQFTFAVTVLFLLGILPEGGRPRYALLFLAVLVKPLTLAAVPALYKRRLPWPAITCCVAALLVALPFFLLHDGQWHKFVTRNFQPVAGQGAGNYGSYEWLFLLNRDLGALLPEGTLARLYGLWRAGLLLATAGLVLASRQRSVVLSAAALLLAHFVSYQHTWEHHMSAVMVLCAALLTVDAASRAQRRCLLACLLLLALPTPFYWLSRHWPVVASDVFLGWPAPALHALVLSKCLPCAVAYGCALQLLWQAGCSWPLSRTAVRC